MRRAQRDVLADALEDASPDLLRFLIRRTTSPDIAADLLGHIALTAWRRRGSAPADRTEIRLWLFGIARHSLANHWRSTKRATEVVARLTAALDDTRHIQDTADQLAERDLLQHALAQLAKPDAEILRLVHWDDLTLAEAATVLEIPASTARSRYATAKAHLRQQLEPQTLETPASGH